MIWDSTYCWHSQKHDNKLFLAEYWMLHKEIGEANQTSATLFQEGCSIAGEMRAINLYAFWWQQRKSSERVSLLQTVQEPDKVAIPSHHTAASPE